MISLLHKYREINILAVLPSGYFYYKCTLLNTCQQTLKLPRNNAFYPYRNPLINVEPEFMHICTLYESYKYYSEKYATNIFSLSVAYCIKITITFLLGESSQARLYVVFSLNPERTCERIKNYFYDVFFYT